jgi:hypothetical protein
MGVSRAGAWKAGPSTSLRGCDFFDFAKIRSQTKVLTIPFWGFLLTPRLLAGLCVHLTKLKHVSFGILSVTHQLGKTSVAF